MSKEGSDLMRRAHELAPFVAEALREVADEATMPDADYSECTPTQRHSHMFAVDIAEAIKQQDTVRLGNLMLDTLQAHAEAARDAALEEYDE